MKQTIFKYQPLLTLLLFFSVSMVMGQVGINTTSPNGILDVNSSTTGLVLPRLALTATNIMAPATNPQGGAIPTGTVVYNIASTNNAPNSVSPGMYVWTGSKWIAQFTKKQTAFYESALDFRTRSNEEVKNITNLVGRTFIPKYTGKYKIELKVNYGGGVVKRPYHEIKRRFVGFFPFGHYENYFVGSDGFLNIAAEFGLFTLQVNKDNPVIANNSLRVQAYSTAYDERYENGSSYFDIWNQYSSILNLSLTAGSPITFSLTFSQYSAPEFEENGNSGDGMGHIASQIPCTVEIIYIGQ